MERLGSRSSFLAKAGIQLFHHVLDPGACPGPDPGFAGVTTQETFYETINIGSLANPLGG